MNRKIAIIASVLPCIFLAACAKDVASTVPPVSGAKSAISVIQLLSKKMTSVARPSAVIGLFSGVYTSQGIIFPVQTSTISFESIAQILRGQTEATTDENFAILREIGDVLQVDIIDLLNRSDDRIQTIDTYAQSLRNTGILIERKISEISVTYENLSDKRREERKTARGISRNLDTALRDQDYGQAGVLEQQLAEANATLAETETKEKAAKDMISRMEHLYEVTGDRLQAIETNREILIAGLRVINVPGIADFNILEKGKSWRKRGSENIFSKPR